MDHVQGFWGSEMVVEYVWLDLGAGLAVSRMVEV